MTGRIEESELYMDIVRSLTEYETGDAPVERTAEDWNNEFYNLLVNVQGFMSSLDPSDWDK